MEETCQRVGTSQKGCQMSRVWKEVCQVESRGWTARQKDDVGKDVGREFGEKQVFVA